ncbi:MAG: hypothetical protein DRJ65_04100 [Acidobacteria bacterium]|nr:MAG: hypothetical protein DRJ65_04100 [Acidobacteriota bacterium]
MVLVMFTAGAVFAQEGPVVAIEIHSEGLESDRDIEDILGLEINKPLDRRRIRQGIQILMAAGEFSWVRVRTEHAENGVKVRVEIDLHPRLAQLDIDTPSTWWRLRV